MLPLWSTRCYSCQQCPLQDVQTWKGYRGITTTQLRQFTQHILRVNFESYIRKHSTIPIVAAPSPVGYGWKLESDELAITWGTLEPAPDSILEYVSCKCKKGCQTRRCSCHKANLKCTELCQCNSCENAEEQELNEMESELIDGEIGDEEMDCDDDDEYV